MNVVYDLPDVEQEDHAEDDEDELRDQVGESEHQVEEARFLDADHVDDDEQSDQSDRRSDMPEIAEPELVKDRAVLPENTEIPDREIGGDGSGGRVVEQLHPADDEADRLVEGATRKAR